MALKRQKYEDFGQNFEAEDVKRKATPPPSGVLQGAPGKVWGGDGHLRGRLKWTWESM